MAPSQAHATWPPPFRTVIRHERADCGMVGRAQPPSTRHGRASAAALNAAWSGERSRPQRGMCALPRPPSGRSIVQFVVESIRPVLVFETGTHEHVAPVNSCEGDTIAHERHLPGAEQDDRGLDSFVVRRCGNESCDLIGTSRRRNSLWMRRRSRSVTSSTGESLHNWSTAQCGLRRSPPRTSVRIRTRCAVAPQAIGLPIRSHAAAGCREG
jgi:hypothetical protein